MFLSHLCYAVIRFSGISLFIRKLIARKKVTIVLYHNPNNNRFEKHLNYLCRRYNLITLSDLSNAIYSKNWKNIPKYALIITFDDGWKENYYLLDLIIKYKFKPTIFLTSHLINTQRNFWWTSLKTKDKEHFKKLQNNQRLLELKEKFDFYQEKEFPGNRQVLNLLEIETMKEFVDFGLHTCFHPILTKCTKEEKRSEIIECKNTLENIIHRKIVAFAYPNGDYNNECIEILKEYGIKTARTVDTGWNSKITDPYKLKITGVSDNGTINKLASELTGIPMFILYFLRGSFNGLKNKN